MSAVGILSRNPIPEYAFASTFQMVEVKVEATVEVKVEAIEDKEKIKNLKFLKTEYYSSEYSLDCILLGQRK